MRLVLLLLATFWAWGALRALLETLVPGIFAATRAVHPLVVAGLPLVVLWPDWVAALAVAGATGILVGLTDRLAAVRYAQVQFRGRRKPGLPNLP